MKKVQILGTGCSKCQLLAKNVEDAARELGIEIEVEKVTDIMEIAKAGVMMTPARLYRGGGGNNKTPESSTYGVLDSCGTAGVGG